MVPVYSVDGSPEWINLVFDAPIMLLDLPTWPIIDGLSPVYAELAAPNILRMEYAGPTIGGFIATVPSYNTQVRGLNGEIVAPAQFYTYQPPPVFADMPRITAIEATASGYIDVQYSQDVNAAGVPIMSSNAGITVTGLGGILAANKLRWDTDNTTYVGEIWTTTSNGAVVSTVTNLPVCNATTIAV